MSQADLLRQALQRPIAFQPMLAKACGGALTGLFLSQLLYWSDKSHDPYGWVYKSQEEWEEETCLTRSEQETARRKLRSAGVLEEDYKRLEHRMFYRIVWAALFPLLEATFGAPTNPTFPNVEIPHSGKTDSDIREVANPAFDPYTETTTETTTESIPKKPKKTPRIVEVTEEFREKMRVKYQGILIDIDDQINECLGHPTTLKHPNKQLTVQGWLRRNAEQLRGTLGIQAGAKPVEPVTQRHKAMIAKMDLEDRRIADGKSVGDYPMSPENREEAINAKARLSS